MKIELKDLTEKLCENYMNKMALQEMGYGAQVFPGLTFEFDSLVWEFFPYFGPSIWVRPIGGSHPKSKIFSPWVMGAMADTIKNHFGVPV